MIESPTTLFEIKRAEFAVILAERQNVTRNEVKK